MVYKKSPLHFNLEQNIYKVFPVNNINYCYLTYFLGPTFIRVRSGKHDSSTAFSHAYDMKKLFDTKAIETKPIMIVSTDGAQDEAPRFPKQLGVAVDLFKTLNLDAYIHVTNASGLSAFNPGIDISQKEQRWPLGIVLDFSSNGQSFW